MRTFANARVVIGAIAVARGKHKSDHDHTASGAEEAAS